MIHFFDEDQEFRDDEDEVDPEEGDEA